MTPGLAGWSSRHTPLPERWSLAAVGVAILALLGVSAWLIAPSLAAQFDELIARVPEEAARLQRHTTSLPPAITIVGQGVMGALTGALGVALATPLTAALLVLVKRIYVEDLLGDATVDDGEAPLAETGDATPRRASLG